jgi:large subunit ribosomal protein L1
MAEAKKKPVVKKTKAEEKAQLDKILQADEAAVDVEAEEVTAADSKLAKAGRRSAKAVKELEEKQAKEERKAAKTPQKAEEAAKAAKKPPRTREERAGKKYRELAKTIDKSKTYSLAEALELATKTSPAKFDATVELHINLGVDPKQADHNIRGTVVLPAGTGKDVKVAVVDDELLAKLDKGVIDFDVLVAAPAFMPKLGKYAKLLGPRGLMPNPKSGTVSADTAKAVKEAQAGRVEYRVDQAGIIHVGVGKVSFGADKLNQNSEAILSAIRSAKPASLKGNYIESIFVATTMGPGIRVAAQ